jgi:acetate kinase
MAAVCDGVSVDTTMGFTPAAGLVMGTRCGDIDPGIFRFLASRGENDPVALDHLFNHESGLAGLSGIGSDIRDLIAAADHSPAARLALDVFCHVAVKQAAGMVASLGGIDRLVFAGGIGEHATSIRQTICEGLGFLGVTLDMEANANSAPKISAEDSRVDVLILPADEEGEMAHIAGTLACSQIN